MAEIDFPRTTKQEIPRANDRFHIIHVNKLSILGLGKDKKSPGKGHGKSWNLIRSKEYEPYYKTWNKYLSW